jgi:hypothetical protein
MAEENNVSGIRDMLSKVLGKSHSRTPSEMIVITAKDRDIVYDLVDKAQRDLEGIDNPDKDTEEFYKAYADALGHVKGVLTERIQSLLSKT